MGIKRVTEGVGRVTEGVGRRAGAALGAVSEAVASARTKAGGDWARRALDTHPRPDVPPTEDWEVSLAGLVARLPRVPGPAVKLLHLLDGLGQVSIGPEQVGFDGEQVDWSRVLEIRCHSSLDFLPGVVVDREVDRIRELFPPVPGRRWLVTKAVEALLTVALAAFDAAERQERALPCEIVSKNLIGRPKPLPGGLFAASVLTLIPEAGDSLLAAARARGIPVVEVENTDAGIHAERAQQLRGVSHRVAETLRGLRADSTDEPTKAELGAAALAELEQLRSEQPGEPRPEDDEGAPAAAGTPSTD
ncbi:hypothetical protein AB0K51_23220 [Kitasatospora sp. NPDC049285]|uniref:hypothetical protein n=1 Tax=Kitasatospora sp. NPDC049285 TaxID=3157096 RepID=UPI00343FDE97